MRWNIGSYDVKYNPKENSKSWGAQDGITTNANGNISNPNLVYNGSQNFTIDIYDKPTYVNKTPTLTGSYIALTEERMTNMLYLLKSDGTYDIINSDGSGYGNGSGEVTIPSGSAITMPTTNPISLVHMDDEIAFLYQEPTESAIMITDKNGVANRKYIYNETSGDISLLDSISWDFENTIYAVNPYGKAYSIDVGNGNDSFLYEFSDYAENKSKSFKKYTSTIVVERNSEKFFGITQNSKDIVLFNINAKIVCKIESRMSNIIDVSHSNYSGSYYIIIGDKVYKMFPNTCRLDVEIIKGIVSNGQVVVYDELGFPSVLNIRDLKIARNRNMQEAKYEIVFSGDIVYSNQTFDSKWYTSNRN